MRQNCLLIRDQLFMMVARMELNVESLKIKEAGKLKGVGFEGFRVDDSTISVGKEKQGGSVLFTFG